MANLSVEIAGIRFPNPIMPAAGPPVRDGRAILRCAAGGAGGLVSKTISTHAATPPIPNIAEIPHGMVNTELWSELPPEQWIDHEYTVAGGDRAAVHRQPGLQRGRHRLARAADPAVRRRGRVIDPLHRRGRRPDGRRDRRGQGRPRRARLRQAEPARPRDGPRGGAGRGRRCRRHRRDQLLRAGPRHRPGDPHAVPGWQRRLRLVVRAGDQAARAALRP